MYSVEIDVTPGDGGAELRIRELRDELSPVVATSVKEWVNDNGNITVRLRSPNKSRIRQWLDANGYEGCEVVKEDNPHVVPRRPRP